MEATARKTRHRNVIDRVLRDPGYHRDVLMGSPLYWPQIEAINMVERHIAERTSQIIPIRSSRQTMKNECSAMCQIRAFTRNRHRGGAYIRTAPTYKPQIVNSKLRLEKMLRNDPLTRGKWKTREGYIYEIGGVQVKFLSTDMSANVVGDTADICLDLDEAHKVDAGKFNEDFSPMTAWTAAPCIMWGVAADKRDLLYEQIQLAKENGGDYLEYPAPIWCELNPKYALHFNERLSRLGESHPVILTQYLLKDIDAVGGFLKTHHLLTLLDTDHNRTPAPTGRKETNYVIVIDIAGADEQELEDPMEKAQSSRDATWALIFEADWGDVKNDYPMYRLLDAYWWVGKAFSSDPGSGWDGQQEILLKLIQLWEPHTTIVDANGIGAQIARYLVDRHSSVVPYTASQNSVSDDLYRTLALLNNQRVKLWSNDDSPEYNEAVSQCRTTGYEMLAHEKMRLVKPTGMHIDFTKCLTYLGRADIEGESEAGISFLEGHSVY